MERDLLRVSSPIDTTELVRLHTIRWGHELVARLLGLGNCAVDENLLEETQDWLEEYDKAGFEIVFDDSDQVETCEYDQHNVVSVDECRDHSHGSGDWTVAAVS